MVPTYGGVGRPWLELGMPEAMVASVASVAADSTLTRHELAHAAYLVGVRQVRAATLDWVDVRTYGDVWQCILREAHAWANGTVHLGADVGLVPLTRRGRAVMRRLADSYGCTPRALWFGIVHAYVARLAWWLALSAVPS
ncbi:MAG: hypothetical protein KGS10_14530 [Chloroflexi bacterium]|nr:hypothetical protein [Chloroflexota bacterium]